MSAVRSRLSYANVMATIAMFLALGGSSYAVSQVNGKRIKPRSITGSKIKKNTLTGKQIKESKLGTVPRAGAAVNAQNLDNLDSTAFLRSDATAGGALAGKYPSPSLAAPESTRLVGASGQPTFQNGWINFGGGFAAAGFYKDPLSRVHLQGVITSGTAGSTAFTLPSGYIPTENHAFAVTAGTGTPNTVSVNVFSNGQVFIFNSGVSNNFPVALDTVSFRVP
jgi:hypothetical protein